MNSKLSFEEIELVKKVNEMYVRFMGHNSIDLDYLLARFGV